MADKRLRHLAEAAVVYPFWHLLRVLPLDVASWLGGMIARTVGPWLSVHRVAENNLRRALPELSDAEVRRTLNAMWDNLGRTVGECPHLPRLEIWRTRLRIEGREHLEAALARGTGVLFLAGHFANWEMAPMTSALEGLPLTFVYRPANNPYVEHLVRRMRAPYNRAMHAKGVQGGIHLVKALARGEVAAMLIDQKLNTGLAVPFFGRDAMTTPAPAEIAHRLGISLVPVRIRREKGAYFTAIFYPPVGVDQEESRKSAVPKTMLALNQMLETWIRDAPAQWFWVHKRWPKER